METGTKIALAVVVAVPVLYLAAVATGVGPGLTFACFKDGLRYCSAFGTGACSMQVSASSCTSIAVQEPALHLCGSHTITWNLTTSGYTFASNGIEFKASVPAGAFDNQTPGPSNFSWRLTPGTKGDFPYSVNLKNAQSQPCTLDPRIYSE